MQNDEKIDLKRKLLEDYFCWKPKIWLVKKERERKFNDKIKCKICLKVISLKILSKHSELCMKTKQYSNQFKIQQKNFNKFITFSDNILRNLKTLYGVEK